MTSFIQTYVEYASGRSSAPERFHKLAALSICGAALENRVWLKAGFKTKVFPSMWICLVGKSDVHKSSAVNIASSLLTQARADIDLPHLFSVEALIGHMAQRPYGFMAWSEIGLSLESLTRDYNAGGMSLLTDLWDSKPSMTRMTKKDGLKRIEFPALSILAAGKPKWFQMNMGAKEVSTGFLGRWLIAWEDTPSTYISFFGTDGYGGDSERHQRGILVERLTELCDMPEQEVAKGDGGAVLDAWGEELQGHQDEDDPAEFAKRGQEQVAKLALCIQASQGPQELRALHPKAVTQAIALWKELWRDGKRLAKELGSDSADASEMDRVLGIIGDRPRIRRSDLLKKTKMLRKKLDPIMETLIESGQVGEEREDSTGGRPPVWYLKLSR